MALLKARARQVVRSEASVAAAMQTWGPHVWRLALMQAPTRQDAEEVYQDVFVRYATEPTRFADDEHLKAWLLRVTVNRCRDCWRTSARHQAMSIDDFAESLASGAPGAEAHLLKNESSQRLLCAVRALPPKLRAVVHLYYGEELPCERIADVLNITPSAVRMRLKRAREQLKRALENDVEYPAARKVVSHASEEPLSLRHREPNPARPAQ